MLLPSASLIAFAISLTAVLAGINWYLWGVTYAADFRLPRLITAPVPALAMDERNDGFKHVA